jgi:hypothetical protein
MWCHIFDTLQFMTPYEGYENRQEFASATAATSIFHTESKATPI